MYLPSPNPIINHHRKMAVGQAISYILERSKMTHKRLSKQVKLSVRTLQRYLKYARENS